MSPELLPTFRRRVCRFKLINHQRKMELEKEELKSYIENDSKTMKDKLDKGDFNLKNKFNTLFSGFKNVEHNLEIIL